MRRRIPKLLFFFMMLVVMLLPRTALAASSLGGFSDVNASTPHVSDVLWLKSMKISTGWEEEDGTVTFRGMSPVVRQDMAAFLYRLAGSPDYEPTAEDMAYFSDVDESTPHYREVLWLYSTGVSEGWEEKDGSHTFRGMDTVKRQDMAAFLHRLAVYMGSPSRGSSSLTFSDVTEKTPHYEDILWLASTGVSEGWLMNDGTHEYRGMNSVVRQDMAAFLHRLYYILYPDRVGEGSVYVALPQLTLHTKPETTPNPSYVPYMTELTYICVVSTSAQGSWSLVEYDGGVYYFWTKAGDESPVTTTKSSRQYATRTSIQTRIVESALDILDNWKTEYVPGEEGEVQPSGAHGFDCSGFASYVLNGAVQQDVPVFELSANLQTLRTETIIYNKGIDGEFAVQDIWSNKDESAFSESELQAGDLLFFNLAEEGRGEEGQSDTCNHVGIYLGNGEFIHCTHTWDRVIIMPLKGIYTEGLVAVRRCVPDDPQPANTTMLTTSFITKLRSTPDSKPNDNIIKEYGKDVEVSVQYIGKTGNWALVNVIEDGNQGYMLTKYLKRP